MGKLKESIIRAQETQFDAYLTQRDLIVFARACLLDALNNADADEGLASAERALALINTYLRENAECTH